VKAQPNLTLRFTGTFAPLLNPLEDFSDFFPAAAALGVGGYYLFPLWRGRLVLIMGISA
jgi:hypothetical protein